MSIKRWLDKEEVVRIYNGVLLSHKKEKSHVICKAWTELEIIILSETSQKEEDKYI